MRNCPSKYWHIAVQLCCALGYALNRGNDEADDTGLDVLLRAARGTAFAADWTRIFATQYSSTWWTNCITEAPVRDPRKRLHRLLVEPTIAAAWSHLV